MAARTNSAKRSTDTLITITSGFQPTLLIETERTFPRSGLHPVPGYGLTVGWSTLAAVAAGKESGDGFEVPASCTLPTAQHPVRIAELEALFATASRTERVGDRHLRVSFPGHRGLDAQVRELTGRESECCSFFDFAVSTRGGQVVHDVRVPAARVDVLDGLAQLSSAGPR